jgi:predicted AAA+ superfamily ATPase
VGLRRYLVAQAANTAGVPSGKTLCDTVGISRVTARAYERVPEMLFVTSRVPASHSNRLKRLVKFPK